MSVDITRASTLQGREEKGKREEKWEYLHQYHTRTHIPLIAINLFLVMAPKTFTVIF